MLAAQEASSVPGCISSTTAAGRGIVPLCSAQEGPHLQCCLKFWRSQYHEVVELLE